MSRVTNSSPDSVAENNGNGDIAEMERGQLVLLFESGQHGPLEQRLRALLTRHPTSGFVWMLLGITLHAQGKEALSALMTAARLLPDDIIVQVNLGNTLADLDRLDEAEAYFRRALSISPDDAFVHYNLANTLFRLGRPNEAESTMRAVLRAYPAHADAHNNLGNILWASNRLAEAETSFRLALEADPQHANAQSNLCNVLRELGRIEEAEAVGRWAVGQNPEAAECHCNLGNTLRELGRLDDAEASYRRALQIDPDLADAHINLGGILNEMGRLEDAKASYLLALRINPGQADALNNLGVTLKELGRLEEAEMAYRQALELKPEFAEAHSNLLFAYNYDRRHTADFCREEATAYGRQIGARVTEKFRAWSCPMQPGKLRIGIVSGDLRSHPVGYFLEALLGQLDRTRIDIFAYSTHHRTDLLTDRIRPCCSAWTSLLGLSDEAAAKRIHDDDLHVLIDLSGHTAHNRLPVFAWKPAPIAVSWLGYFATTGVAEIDYILVDEYGVAEDRQKDFTEKLWYLPDTRLCFTPPRTALPVAPAPALSRGYITFGCFQNLTKLGEDVLHLWSRILAALPTARLRWQCKQLGDPSVIRQFRARLLQHGVDSSRVTLLGPTSYEDYLAAYAEVDVILDTFPFPGGTTTCEALWMGVPTLTLAGDTLLSRQGASILGAAGLTEFVATDAVNYVEKATRLAEDIPGLAAIRSRLRTQLVASPLFDSARFARNFEDALWGMWRAWETLQGTAMVGNRRTASPARPMQQLADDLRNVGAAHLQHGRLAEAETSYRDALKIEPDVAEAHFKLGNILAGQNRLDAAESCYRQAIALDPDHVKALYNLGNTLKQLSRIDEAERCYRRVAAIDPSYTNAHNNLGVLLHEQGRHHEAEDVYRHILTILPEEAVTLNNLGLVLMAQGHLDDAEASLQQAIASQPNYPEALNNLGVVLKEQGHLVDAEELYRAALALRPKYPDALNNLGVTLKLQGRLDEAEDAYRKAIDLTPHFLDALNNLGNVLKEQGRLAEAEDCFRNALALDPDCAEAHNNLGTVLSDQCRRFEATASFRRAFQIQPDYPEAHSNLLFIINYDEQSQSILLEESRRYGRIIGARTKNPFVTWPCEVNLDRLRVGIVSGDLRNHPVGYFLQGVLANIDANRIEFVAYPTNNWETELTTRIRPYFTQWKPISGLHDVDAANLIHSDRVHILLDLSGHTANNRLPVFARKPAPIQASWLGYCATTGMAAMDYYIADPLTLPESEAQSFTETIWRLPMSYLCFMPLEIEASPSAPPACHRGHVTFGSFNNLTKIGTPVIELWTRVVNSVPGSKLLLKAPQLGDITTKLQIANQFAAHGIHEDRLILQGAIADRGEHLASYSQMDIALDPFPYNGVTTTVEALWMGVPVLTLAGSRFLARQGVGLLTNTGLSDWIAVDNDDYVAKAIAHSANLDQLRSLRARLRQQVSASALFDSSRFARDFEEALWGMWRARST